MAEDNSKTLWPGWKTVREIGRGSFGTVYEIERDNYGHKEKSALKVVSIPQSASDVDDLISDGYDEESITARFQEYMQEIVQEYSLMADMKGCANIVYCDDWKAVQHDDGMGWDIFIRMELLTPLPKALETKISDSQVIKIGADICNALAFCEKRNLLHRDIKPQNIFVAPDGTYKLGDFGIAKTAERTTSGTKIGTYKFMAPEVFNNQPYGVKADIYSLGLVLYWLLNERRTPFLPRPPKTPTSTDEYNARTKRFNGESIPAPAHGSKELQKIVLRACAYRPEDRYSSANDFLAALNSINPKQAESFTVEPGDETSASELSSFDKVDESSRTVSVFSSMNPPSCSNDDNNSGTLLNNNRLWIILSAVAVVSIILIATSVVLLLGKSHNIKAESTLSREPLSFDAQLVDTSTSSIALTPEPKVEDMRVMFFTTEVISDFTIWEGDPVDLTVHLMPATLQGLIVDWKSSDTDVLTVTKTGEYTARIECFNDGSLPKSCKLTIVCADCQKELTVYCRPTKETKNLIVPTPSSVPTTIYGKALLDNKVNGISYTFLQKFTFITDSYQARIGSNGLEIDGHTDSGYSSKGFMNNKYGFYYADGDLYYAEAREDDGTVQLFYWDGELIAMHDYRSDETQLLAEGDHFERVKAEYMWLYDAAMENGVREILGSGIFSSETGVPLNIRANWTATAVNQEQAKIIVEVWMDSYSIANLAARDAIIVDVGGNRIAADAPAVDITDNSTVHSTLLATTEHIISISGRESTIIPIKVKYLYNGVYFNQVISEIECGGTIELSRFN